MSISRHVSFPGATFSRQKYVSARSGEEEEEINVVDLSDTEDCARPGPSTTADPPVSSAENPSSENSPLDLSYKSQPTSSVKASDMITSKTVFNRPSVIRSSDLTFESSELPDVEEHFRKSLGANPKVFTEAEAKVDDHFARALGEMWWALKDQLHAPGSLTRRNARSDTPPQSQLSPRERYFGSGSMAHPHAHLRRSLR